MQEPVNVDEELQMVKEGDVKAIEKMCSITWEPLYRFIYFKVQNREEAEDITQETYVKTLTYLQEHQTPRGNFLGFIKTVAMNVLRDRWRRKKRQGVQMSIEDINSEIIAQQDHQEAVTRRLYVENALAKLTKDQRTILELRIIEGYSVAETARLSKKTEAAVRTIQYRGLLALSRMLDGSDI